MSKKLLVVGAHSADFVWRSAGTIAKTVAEGGTALVVALSYGERGESGELWKEDPTRSEADVKRIRHEQAEQAAAIVGAEFRAFDWGDYPLLLSPERESQLAELIRDYEPDVILTHTEKDPFNPDHPLAFQVVQRARLLAAGAGVASAFKNIVPPEWYSFEPHQPELSGFVPDTFVDITSVMEKKVAAMACMGAQSYLQEYYTELAGRRGNHARRISGRSAVKYAEAHQSMVPRVADTI